MFLNKIDFKTKIPDSFIRFCVVGLFINVPLNYLVFWMMLSIFNIQYSLAGILGFFAGAFSGYTLNRAWTFKSKVAYQSGLFKYLLIQAFCLSIHTITQVCAVKTFLIPEVFSQFISIVITTFVNYFLSRKFAFGVN